MGEKIEKVEKVTKSIAREIMEWIICIVVAFTLAIVIKYFLFTPTLVQQSSMYPTIFNDERVFVNRLARTLKSPINRGDIITLEAPNGRFTSGDIKANYIEYKGKQKFIYNVLEIGKISYIKRVIGISGDTIRFENNKVYLNGKELDESAYLPEGTITDINESFSHVPLEFTVPAGYIFAMGDNRTYSRDCRQLGCIPLSKVEGKVGIRLWPLNKFGTIKKSTVTKDEVDQHNSGVLKAKI